MLSTLTRFCRKSLHFLPLPGRPRNLIESRCAYPTLHISAAIALTSARVATRSAAATTLLSTRCRREEMTIPSSTPQVRPDCGPAADASNLRISSHRILRALMRTVSDVIQYHANFNLNVIILAPKQLSFLKSYLLQHGGKSKPCKPAI